MPRLIAWLLVSMTCVGCLTIYPEDHWAVNQESSTGSKDAFASQSNAFALDLYTQLRTGEGNLFFSPYSISTALAMTSAGARGQTLDEMTRVLHLPDQADLHPGLSALTAGIQRRAGKDVELTTANALWAQKGRKFRDDFLALTRKHYGASLQQVDFIGDTESARRTINEWTEKQTHKRIRDLIRPGVLSQETRLVLTNAIYFKAKWDKEFDLSNTRDRDFTHTGGAKVKKPMMAQTDTFGYAESDKLRVLEMPYVGKEFSLVILLPDRDSTLADLETRMPKELTSWLGKLTEQEVIVTVPRFEMTKELSLSDTLSRMGMSKAFSAGADFTGIDDGRERLRINDVIHKAFVEVGEKGTEAAAATAIEISAPLSAPDFQLQRPPEFTADRPFVYLIRDRQSGSILFLGRYMGN